jgi:uncharacterized protein (DUF2141 family)
MVMHRRAAWSDRGVQGKGQGGKSECGEWKMESGEWKVKQSQMRISAAPKYRSVNMNGSISWKSTGVSMGVRCVAWCMALLLANLATIAFARAPCPGIHVKILNIRNSTGTVACALFESSVGFPTEFLRSATNVMVIKIRDAEARCDFEDIPPGTYAMAVIHDENMNGKLDTGILGFPREGYGFSKDAKALIGVPSFSAASFSYDGQNLGLTMSLHY